MRRALATTGAIGVLTLAGLGAGAGPAMAAALPTGGTSYVAQGVDVDEPASQDGDDDSGKYGLVGLTGMLGLFGYRHYRNRTVRSTGTSGPIGGVDTDGSGSRRV